MAYAPQGAKSIGQQVLGPNDLAVNYYGLSEMVYSSLRRCNGSM